MNKEIYRYLPTRESSIDILKGAQYLENYHLTPSSYAYLNGSLKRILDIVGAILGIILGFPILTLAALVIKFVDKVPVIYSQKRYGYGGRDFTIHKLRTLKSVDIRKAVLLENIQNKPAYATTRTGKIWRVTSIDEIIQFWLVLKGDMSLIGHRPLPMYYMKYLTQLDGLDQRKLDHYLNVVSRYKPGLSSLSSVNGRGDLTMQQKMEYDLIYAQKADFILDIKLLLRTIIAVLARKGAK